MVIIKILYLYLLCIYLYLTYLRLIRIKNSESDYDFKVSLLTGIFFEAPALIFMFMLINLIF